jgi:hypothetical protein
VKLRTLIAVAAFGLASLACGGGGTTGPGGYSIPTVELCAPFTELSLPIEDGGVISCSSNAVTVSYATGDKKALFDQYWTAVKGHASNEIVPATESSGTWSGVLQDGNKMNYVVNAMDAMGGVYITVGANPAP